MDLEYATEEHADITLVTVDLENTHRRPRYVEIVAELDAPILPPREDGYPAQGWDDTGYQGTVDPGAHLVLGFACPAPPTDPPVTIETVEPTTEPSQPRSPGDIVRELGDPRPPTAVVDPEAPSTDDDSNDANGAVPPVIGAWFDAIATRIDDDAPVETDRLGAVADRATDLHRRSQQ